MSCRSAGAAAVCAGGPGPSPGTAQAAVAVWLFGRFAASGSTVTAYADAEEPVSALINDYGSPVASAAAARRRAAMPFIHLEREIWDLRDASGAEIGPRVPESGPG